MINNFVTIGIGAVIAVAPLAAAAQTEQLAQAAPAATPNTSMAGPATKHIGSHRSHIRRTGNVPGHRARSLAHQHMSMAPKPAAPSEAPKS
jgi:hypothetical protein